MVHKTRLFLSRVLTRLAYRLAPKPPRAAYRDLRERLAAEKAIAAGGDPFAAVAAHRAKRGLS